MLRLFCLCAFLLFGLLGAREVLAQQAPSPIGPFIGPFTCQGCQFTQSGQTEIQVSPTDPRVLAMLGRIQDGSFFTDQGFTVLIEAGNVVVLCNASACVAYKYNGVSGWQALGAVPNALPGGNGGYDYVSFWGPDAGRLGTNLNNCVGSGCGVVVVKPLRSVN